MKKLILFSIIILCGLQTTKNVDATNYQMATRVDLGYAHATQLMPVSTFTNSVLWMPFSQQTSFYSIAKTPDFSADHNDATVYGATFDNGSYSFAGVNDYIDIAMSVSYPYTFTCWCKVTDTASRSFISTSTGTDPYYDAIFKLNDNTVRSRSYDGTVSDAVASIDITNRWVFISGVFDISSRQIFVDGVAGVENTDTKSTGRTGKIRVGYLADSTPLYPMLGNIDDVRIYDRALTGLEITNIYNRTKSAH